MKNLASFDLSSLFHLKILDLPCALCLVPCAFYRVPCTLFLATSLLVVIFFIPEYSECPVQLLNQDQPY